ncbi:hypothetical protein ILUMI_04557 [Ignelater luminosus]|uniref:Uncharacterized protein n=1 Tax=Ignelater luminosus TaxID=2038154 RepID=A0A8K0GH85_IGNLU|nr:hypothetical protein ILUMI_04557 [Ignelater luminosus]
MVYSDLNILSKLCWCCLRPKDKNKKKGKKIQIADGKKCGRNRSKRKENEGSAINVDRESSRSKASSGKSSRTTVGKQEESNISFTSSSYKSKGSVPSKVSYVSNTSTL